jgi:hypothetical protein
MRYIGDAFDSLSGRFPVSQLGRQLALEKTKELILSRPNLNQDNVIVPNPDKAIDRLQMTVDRWSAAHDLGYRLEGHVPAHRCKPAGVGQFRHHRPAGYRPAEILMRRLSGVFLSLGIAHRHLGIAWPRATGRDERLNEIGPWLGRDQGIRLFASEL